MTTQRNTAQALQQIYLSISRGSWVGYTLDESGNQTQECIYAPTKKLAQVYLRMQIQDVTSVRIR